MLEHVVEGATLAARVATQGLGTRCGFVTVDHGAARVAVRGRREVASVVGRAIVSAVVAVPAKDGEGESVHLPPKARPLRGRAGWLSLAISQQRLPDAG